MYFASAAYGMFVGKVHLNKKLTELSSRVQAFIELSHGVPSGELRHGARGAVTLDARGNRTCWAFC